MNHLVIMKKVQYNVVECNTKTWSLADDRFLLNLLPLISSLSEQYFMLSLLANLPSH